LNAGVIESFGVYQFTCFGEDLLSAIHGL
jgi:hypothetical protein